MWFSRRASRPAADAVRPPACGQGGDFFIRALALHGQQLAARRQQVAAEADDFGEGAERARGQAVEGCRRAEVLRAGGDHVYPLAKAEVTHRLALEARLLAGRLDQGHAQGGARNRHRNARQAGAAADVDQRVAIDVRGQRQRLQ